MSSVGIRELRQNASVLLRRVATGESLIVTDRGRPVARLSPITAGGGIDDLRATGLIREPLRRMRDAPAPIALPSDRPTPAEVLAAARADER